jgi:hypothetical protein
MGRPVSRALRKPMAVGTNTYEKARILDTLCGPRKTFFDVVVT